MMYHCFTLLVLVAIVASFCRAQDIASGITINSGVTIDENGVTIGSSTPSFSGSPLTFKCPDGCMTQSYSPVIFTSEVAISTLQQSCTCMGCPSGGIVKCTFYRDGKELAPTDTVLAAVAAGAQSVTATGSGITEIVSESQGSMIAMGAVWLAAAVFMAY